MSSETFSYKGISAGKYIEGEIEAINQEEASFKLKEQKVIITNLTKVKKKKGGKDKQIDANILKTQERIEKILGLKINISNKKNNSGKITIEYKNLDQFELVSDLLTKN